MKSHAVSRHDLEIEARSHPGGWVYEIDWPYRDDQSIPPEAIKGAWKVNDSGILTREFEVNNMYREIVRASRQPRAYLKDIAEMQIDEGHTERDEWMIEIDPDFDDQFPNIPREGIIGHWYVGSDGRYTDMFRPNPLYSGRILT